MTTFTLHLQRKFDSKKCRDSVARFPTRTFANEVLRFVIMGGAKFERNSKQIIRLKKEPKKKDFSMYPMYHRFLNVYKGLLLKKVIFDGTRAIETKRLNEVKKGQNG